MKPYTVILMYPDYLSENYGEESYAAHVTAVDGDAAVLAAQIDAVAQNTDDGEDPPCEDPTDFAVIAVYAGHLEQEPWG